MIEVAIFGAGSIGNHLAHSCRKVGWNVTIFDISASALERMKSEIFPKRYESWDSSIKLKLLQEFTEYPKEFFDVCLIGTPPETHLKLMYLTALANPKIIMVEKPVSTPDLSQIMEISKLISTYPDIEFLAGYNHRVSLIIRELIRAWESFGCNEISELEVKWLENWQGIMNAHPWLSSPKDSYLGFTSRGGGALFEHSHGIDIWLWLSRFFRVDEPTLVEATGTIVGKIESEDFYDEDVLVKVSGNSGYIGSIRQNVVDAPAEKSVYVKDSKYEYLCRFHVNGLSDTLTITNIESSQVVKKVECIKVRSIDFDEEIYEVQKTLTDIKLQVREPSPLNMFCGLRTAILGCAAIESLRTSNCSVVDFSGVSSTQFQKK
jgi:predicted dehydrogenase